jgi:hypothetical protein
VPQALRDGKQIREIWANRKRRNARAKPCTAPPAV